MQKKAQPAAVDAPLWLRSEEFPVMAARGCDLGWPFGAENGPVSQDHPCRPKLLVNRYKLYVLVKVETYDVPQSLSDRTGFWGMKGRPSPAFEAG
jgi:hypothetical protein